MCVCLCFRSSLSSGPDWTELNRTSEMDGMLSSHLSILRLTDWLTTGRPIPALPAPNNPQADQCAGAGSARHHLPTPHLLISPSLYPSPRWRDLFLIFPSYHIPSHSIWICFIFLCFLKNTHVVKKPGRGEKERREGRILSFRFISFHSYLWLLLRLDWGYCYLFFPSIICVSLCVCLQYYNHLFSFPLIYFLLQRLGRAHRGPFVVVVGTIVTSSEISNEIAGAYLWGGLHIAFFLPCFFSGHY